MAFAYPAGNNTFVPSFDASGHLVVAFSRNPKDFALNRYITLTPVKKSVGYYLRITPEQAARVLNDDLSEFVWPDGNDAPTGDWGTESFSFFPYATTRYTYPFRLGYKANEQADWKILASHAAIAAQDAMTARTVVVAKVANTTSNYPSNHVDSATNQGGGFWSAGTTANPIIQKTLNAAAQRIQIDTLGKVRPKDLVLVINPVVASKMATSAEVHDYVKQSPFAMAQIRGDSPSNNGLWGLPDLLYGYKVEIEDAVRVSTRKKAASTTANYLWDSTNNNAVLLARPGALVSEATGGPSFGTIHVFSYEELTTEQKDDSDNRRIAGRVVEDFDVQMVAPVSGYYITNLYS